MPRRLPSQPPVLSGFTYVHVLGSGGFADVFLYEQNMPRRQVAVKVMLSEMVNDQVRRMFQAEANVMAQLSGHPSILTVFQASVSGDGRPYIAMEFCSSQLNDRYRRERIPVGEVLRIGVKIGSAIETAHRAGVLHRDIKPSNILLTAYGHPVLSDFGIASSLTETDSHEVIGMSIPWSAPEVLGDETSGTVESEVWAFAATIYSLLAGRSPFELPGASNKPSELLTRITRARPQPIGRPDVPASLEQALLRAMSRKPGDRQSSIIELVREFQGIETELGLPQTPIEVAMDDWALASVSDLDDRTVVRGAVNRVATDVGRRRRTPRREAPSPDGTVVRGSNSLARSIEGGIAATPRTLRLMMIVIAGLLALILGGGAAVAVTMGGGSSIDDIPVVSDIGSVTRQGAVEFTWPDPGLESSDIYQITSPGHEPSVQSSAGFTVEADAGERTCITVTVIRDGRSGSPSAEKCADSSP